MGIYELIRDLGFASLVLAAVAYAVRAVFDLSLTRALEEFKSDLRADAFKHEIIFSRLHDRRAKIIAELYAAISALEKAMDIFLDPRGVTQPRHNDDNGLKVGACGDRADNCFRQNQIYFDPGLCKEIKGLLERFYRMWAGTVTVRINDRDVPIDGPEWMKLITELKEEIPPILQVIEYQFRDILGVYGIASQNSKRK